MALPEWLVNAFNVVTPLVEWVIVLVTPIYIAIGGIFASIALMFIRILPSDSYVLSWIVMGAFIVLGIVFAVLAEKKRNE
ncbi:MAG: hypothetical protein ACTSWW_00280 [Promethearchaeota archaeon]